MFEIQLVIMLFQNLRRTKEKNSRNDYTVPTLMQNYSEKLKGVIFEDIFLECVEDGVELSQVDVSTEHLLGCAEGLTYAQNRSEIRVLSDSVFHE